MSALLSKPVVALVYFKGNTYLKSLLTKQAGPSIEIKADELHQDWDSLVTSTDQQRLDNGLTIFAKYEGKYVVLAGYIAAIESMRSNKPIKGKLLSNPTLKRALHTV